MGDNVRFDNWPPLIPKVGEAVQIQVGKSTFETTVITRGVSPDKETFYIVVFDPCRLANITMIISPTAGGMGNDPMKKPFWQVREESSNGYKYELASLFFLN